MGCVRRTRSAVVAAACFQIIGAEQAWAAGPAENVELAPPPVDAPPPTEPPPNDPAEAVPEPPVVADPVAESEPEAPPEASSETSGPEPVTPASRAPAVETPAPAAEPSVETPTTRWYDDFTIGAFVDAYASFNANLPVGQSGSNALRAFDSNNGFALAWAGLDIAYDTKRAAAVVALRFGPATNAGWQDDGVPGIQHVKQAYARWKVTDKLNFDFGRWDTIFGAEVAESWMNHNYTRGFLYNLAQPFWHTGLRMGAQPLPSLGINVIAVNGWGQIIDNNRGKSVGAQIAFTPGEVFKLYAGYLGGPEQNEIDAETGDRIDGTNREFRHLADVVVRLDWKRLSAVFNGDYVYDGRPRGIGPDVSWWGVMGSLRYAFLEKFAAAVRGDFVADPNGALTGDDALLTSATVTLDVRPVEPLVLRLEGRYDGSNRGLFPAGLDSTSPHQGTVTLGVVVTSF